MSTWLESRISEACCPSIFVNWHARVEKISLVLVKVPSGSVGIRVLEHAVIVVVIFVCMWRLIIIVLDGVLFAFWLRLFALEHTCEVVSGALLGRGGITLRGLL